MTRQILLVVVLLTAAPVCAQDQTGPQGGDGSGDGGRKSTDTRNVFTDSLGALLTGFLATPTVNANLNTNLKDIVGKSS